MEIWAISRRLLNVSHLKFIENRFGVDGGRGEKINLKRLWVMKTNSTLIGSHTYLRPCKQIVHGRGKNANCIGLSDAEGQNQLIQLRALQEPCWISIMRGATLTWKAPLIFHRWWNNWHKNTLTHQKSNWNINKPVCFVCFINTRHFLKRLAALGPCLKHNMIECRQPAPNP